MSDQNREAMEMRRRRADYRAKHRGTKEMDIFLGRFAEARLSGYGEEELKLFEELLGMPDPDINSWLLAPERLGTSAFLPLIRDIRRFHGLET